MRKRRLAAGAWNPLLILSQLLAVGIPVAVETRHHPPSSPPPCSMASSQCSSGTRGSSISTSVGVMATGVRASTTEIQLDEIRRPVRRHEDPRGGRPCREKQPAPGGPSPTRFDQQRFVEHPMQASRIEMRCAKRRSPLPRRLISSLSPSPKEAQLDPDPESASLDPMHLAAILAENAPCRGVPPAGVCGFVTPFVCVDCVRHRYRIAFTQSGIAAVMCKSRFPSRQGLPRGKYLNTAPKARRSSTTRRRSCGILSECRNWIRVARSRLYCLSYKPGSKLPLSRSQIVSSTGVSRNATKEASL